MAIKKQFGGATIRKPGAYSRSQTSPDGGGQSAETGVLFIIGEADAGPGGSDEGIQRYSAAALNQLKAKYRSGPLVDAAKAAAAPSRTPGIGGAGTYLVWKTNASDQASLALANSYATAKAREYGIGGNRITYKNVLSAETAPTISGSADVTDFAGLNTLTLLVRQNGGAVSTVTFSTPANMAAVVSQINAVVSGLASDDAGTLKLTMAAASNHHRNGFGRTLEVSGGTALTRLFLIAELASAASEPQASLELIQPRDSATESGVVGGTVALTLGRDSSGSCTAATVAISSTAVTLSQTGATPSSYSFLFADYPLIGGLVDAINDKAGWTASCTAAMRTQSIQTLDQIAATGAFSAIAGEMPCRVKQDAQAVSDFFGASTLADLESQVGKGLPDAEGRSNLTGGARNASSSSDFDAGFSAALAQDLNAVLPCISQDASDDIAAGLTDPSSTYDVETVHAMLDTHLRLRGSIKNRKEAQGFAGYRKPTKAEAFEQAAKMGSELIQMCMEDVLLVDSSNELKWKQPHMLAALMAGMRMGSEIGEPLTHKFFACQGVGHYVNASTGKVMGDYNPLVDYDEAISAGVTSSEPAAGSFRCMLDNTTYGADESFVFNRGSVVEAAQYIAKTIRGDAEASFVGRKTAVITAEGIKNRIRTKLVELFKGKITSASEDAPQGWVEKTFTVEVVGNTATVSVEVKPVQGLDFVFITFTLGETRQSA